MPGAAAAAGGGGGGSAPTGGRRRPQSQYSHQQYQSQHVNPMYQHQHSFMNPYANSYYPQIPHHYPNGAMNAPYSMPYNQYPQHPQRSPPVAMHQPYPPIVSSSMQQPPQPYSRPPPPPQQPSPAMSTPPLYSIAAPPSQDPIPQAPSSTHSTHSTHSSQAVQAPLTPPTPKIQDVAPHPSEVEVIPPRGEFRAPLPWLSRPDLPFPTRTTRSKGKRSRFNADAESVELPTNPQAAVEAVAEANEATSDKVAAPGTPKSKAAASVTSSAVPIEAQATPEKPSTQNHPSEDIRPTSPSTPASVKTTAASITPTLSNKTISRTAVPALPIVPPKSKASPKEVKTTSGSESHPSDGRQDVAQAASEKVVEVDASSTGVPQTELNAAPAPAKTAPKLWSNLFMRPAATATALAGAGALGSIAACGAPSAADAVVGEGSGSGGGFAESKASSLAEALHSYRVSSSEKIAFLEPRGLINTGNMCYMNSVLQVLIFCLPFYDFLDQVSKKAAHSFKSETPLIEAMIMFMREYKVIDSAISVEQLRRRLKSEELEQYGEAFTPKFVYNAIRELPRFASMRRGHQQDAEEFLGFLLESLHDECAKVMQQFSDSSATTTAANSSAATPTAAVSPTNVADSSDWLEVGRRQKPAVTRSSGHPIASSPITKIFSGQLRSELRITGRKDSITLEPFQPLQLDIGSPQIHNIVDALKGLTKPETLHGEFGSPRGPGTSATKQVFIESLPPVLILHLKRFQFDAEGTGTVKIWKKIGYPLELELPKEILSRQKRNALLAEGAGLPKYRLIAAVYHHGKNASGGHYTVDLRRQDCREWIRLDDTVIRRIRSEDVAEGGVEEDRSKTTTWVDKKDSVMVPSGNRFDGIGDDDAGDEEGWNKVSAPVNGAKKWSTVVNGGGPNTAAPAKGKPAKDNIKDNKVAYLLFYQRV
ncbi:Uu.00g099870.m01.CDS01 [Anthostomella pinea]|uniref:ubiquitinyl hydrolase 1 n=1 Tax=Anthostomella pinea TaxID=933095 RepID=A0AAI8YFE2_9PEZI|nr:Uu.00g099870.m01.CDS01 [Anthostomella pinea]